MIVAVLACAFVTDADLALRMDLDGDGVPRPDDCDDDDDAIGAPAEYRLDADGDGYGGSVTESGCEASAGYVEQGGDCDDGNPLVHPRGVEACDEADADEDCDGRTDDADDAPTGTTVAWLDADGDGFGDASLPSDAACERPAGHSREATDCDDGDPAVHPAAEEVCGDGIDQDCDGGPGACAPGGISLADADARLDGEVYGDGAGTAVAAAGDVDGDGRGDMLVGAPYAWSGAATMVGAAWLALGAEDLGRVSLGEAPYRFDGAADGTGVAVAGGHDVDGDGGPDILIGAGTAMSGGEYTGGAWLILGPDALADASIADIGERYTGAAEGDFAGTAVAMPGDVDGDGRADLLVGAYGHQTAGYLAGAAYLVLGSPEPSGGPLDLGNVRYTGGYAEELAGISLAGAGDVDGDGHADLLIGAYGNRDAGPGAGAAHLVLGGEAPSSRSLADADATCTGAGRGDIAGYAVAGAGDVDADGHDDLLVGAPSTEHAGELAGSAYLVLGSAAPASSSLVDAVARFDGEEADDLAGSTVAGAGDVDGDTFADLLVGGSGEYASQGRAAAWLIFGEGAPRGGSLSLAGGRFTAEEDGAYAGAAVAGAGDVDADGYADVLVGAAGATGDESQAGAVYVILGGGM